MTNKSEDKPADKPETLILAGELLTDMVKELCFRGCDEDHPLVTRAGELIVLLKKAAEQRSGRPDRKSIRLPDRLHLMTAESVSRLDLTNFAGAGLAPHTRIELAEAAFTFENEFMALLGDDNTIPMDVYSAMAEDQLIKVIKAAVENICRLRPS